MRILRRSFRALRLTPDAIRRYRARVSGPLLDRIDMQVEVPRIALTEFGRTDLEAESSATVRARVEIARDAQAARAQKPNAALLHHEVQRDCALTGADRALLERALDKLGLSARAYQRILRVARTIADLAASEPIATAHLAEAIQYRRVTLQS